MSTTRHNIIIMIGMALLALSLLACGPLLLLNRSQKPEVTEVTVVVEQASPTVSSEPPPTPVPPTQTPEITAEPMENTSGDDETNDVLSDVVVTDLLFFEAGADLPDYDDRTYATTFSQATTRYITWELNLDYPEPGEQVDFEIYAIWYAPDGQILAEQTMENAYLGADWTSSAHAMGWGWDERGQWDSGEYTVELYVGDRRMATGIFEIVPETADTVDTSAAGPIGRIAFVSERDNNRDIYVINVDGTGEIRLTDAPEEDDEPAWSPDGERITFYSYRDGNGELYVVSADGSDLERLTATESDEWSPAWSPDGAWIAFTSDRDGERHLYVMPAVSRESDGGDWMRVTASPGADWKFDWSPDGTTIIFDSDRDGARQLYTIPAPDAEGRVDETAITLLVADDNGVFDAAWSPDGRYLAFTATKPMANGRIDLVQADGSGRVTLTEDRAGDAAPTWSPDGAWIAFTSYRDGEGEIFVMSAPGSATEGTEPFNVTNTPGISDGWPAWSPN